MNERLEALEQLGRLRDQRVLTDEEFDAEKARLLSLADPLPEETTRSRFARFAWATPKRIGIALGILGAVGAGAYLGLTSATAVSSNPTGQTKSNETKATLPEQQTPRLSAILKFDRPDECKPSDELTTLLADMRSLESSSATKLVNVGLSGPSFPAEVSRAEQGTATIARLSVPGVLSGLKLSEIRTVRHDGSDIESFQLRFSENAERVRTKLNELGFNIAKLDEARTVDLEDGRTLSYGVEKVENGSALTCAII